MTINIKSYDIIIDDEDYEKIKQYTWNIIKNKKNTYKQVISQIQSLNKKSQLILLHRLIMNFPKNKEVDHINGNTLDNRKCNLRICSHSQNIRNSKKRKDNNSGYKGVYISKKRYKNKVYFYWITEIKIDDKIKFLGNFPYTEKGKRDAYKVYCDAAKRYYCEFANFG